MTAGALIFPGLAIIGISFIKVFVFIVKRTAVIDWGNR